MKKIILIILVLILASTIVLAGCSARNETRDNFAKCLTEKGAVFYGAFWCPHCADQKKLFGNSMDYVNYVECSTPDGKAQTALCQQKNIPGYPTWDFSDGSRASNVLSFEALGEKTSCSLPAA